MASSFFWMRLRGILLYVSQDRRGTRYGLQGGGYGTSGGWSLRLDRRSK